MFFDPSDFAFVEPLERDWRLVREEFERLEAERFMPWPERFLYEAGWDVYGLYAFGRRLPDNCARCPQTARLVESIPGMTTAGFSLLAPGTHIRPHCGYTQAVLRCHLGLVVPDGCELRVGEERRAWAQGTCLVFDDTCEHEAWNRSAVARAVLLIDFRRPGTAARSIATPVSVRGAVESLTRREGEREPD